MSFTVSDYFVIDTHQQIILSTDQTAPGIVSEINLLQPQQDRSTRLTAQDVHPNTWYIWQAFRHAIELANQQNHVLWCRDANDRKLHDLRNHWLVTQDGVEFKQVNNQLEKITQEPEMFGVIPGFGSLNISPTELRILEAIAYENGVSLSRDQLLQCPQTKGLSQQQIEQSTQRLLEEGLLESEQPLKLTWDAYVLVENP